jgi:hypothetical protein
MVSCIHSYCKFQIRLDSQGNCWHPAREMVAWSREGEWVGFISKPPLKTKIRRIVNHFVLFFRVLDPPLRVCKGPIPGILTGLVDVDAPVVTNVRNRWPRR